MSYSVTPNDANPRLTRGNIVGAVFQYFNAISRDLNECRLTRSYELVRARTTSPKNRLYMHRPTFWNRRIIRCASRTVIHLSLSRSRVLDHCQLPSIEPKREPHSSLLIQRVMLCLSTFCFPTFCFSAPSPSFFYQFFHSPECFFPVVLFLLFFLMAFEMEFVQRS